MSEQDKDRLTDHTYDGIREYDNPTPSWWTWLFILTIAFSTVYFLISALSGWRLGAIPFYEQYAVENMKRQYGGLGEVKPDAPTILKLAYDPKWIKVGAAIFQTNCVTCHGRDGEGLSGPNLTDDAYTQVKRVEDICDVIAKGRSNGAMPAWSTRLQPVEVVLVGSYVASLRGQNRPGRPPEGQAIAPWRIEQ